MSAIIGWGSILKATSPVSGWDAQYCHRIINVLVSSFANSAFHEVERTRKELLILKSHQSATDCRCLFWGNGIAGSDTSINSELSCIGVWFHSRPAENRPAFP